MGSDNEDYFVTIAGILRAGSQQFLDIDLNRLACEETKAVRWMKVQKIISHSSLKLPTFGLQKSY